MLTSLSVPDIHLLKVFIKVAEAGGFSRAQIALNVGQSTISAHMIDLEARLGFRLCRRGRAGFALTEEGHEIYRLAKELLSDCSKFVSQANSIRGDVTGLLHIATADALLGNRDFPFEEILTRLRDEMPTVTLQLSVMDPIEIERRVLDKKVNMGLHTFPNRAPGLRYLPMFEEIQNLYCGKGHPLFDIQNDINISNIESYEYVSRSYYGGALRPGKLKPKRSPISSGNMEGITASILSGKFLGHLPDQCAEPWVQKGLMKPVKPSETSYSALFECVFSTGIRMSRAQKILETIFEAHAMKR